MDKPKILVIPSWYPNPENTSGGTQFQEQSELFLERFDVRVLFGTQTGLNHLQWLRKYGLSKSGELDITTTAAGLKEYRFEYHSWFNNERKQIGSQIQAYQEVLAEMTRQGWKPDLIHARCVNPAGIISSHLSRTFGIPWVLSEHQVFALGNHTKFRAGLMRQAIKTAAAVTVVSQHQLRSFINHFLYRHYIVTGNLVDEEMFPLAQPDSKPGIFRILTVMYPGRIKDPETFFKAIAALIQKGHTDIQATVIGRELFSTADIEAFKHFARQHDVMDYCHFIPYASREEMPAYYVESDVFVSTSLAETFGIAVREAMAVGRPVVCTASGGVDDDIFDFNGFKVNIYDHEAVANAIIAIKTGAVTNDPSKIREYVVTRYGRQAYLDRFSTIYEQVLNSDKNQSS